MTGKIEICKRPGTESWTYIEMDPDLGRKADFKKLREKDKWAQVVRNS